MISFSAKSRHHGHLDEPKLEPELLLSYRAQLFKTNDVVSKRIAKTLIIKYGIYAIIFAEQM